MTDPKAATPFDATRGSPERPMDEVLHAIVEQNLEVYRHAPSRLQEDVSQEAQVADDYRGRLVYELLQNADDAMAGHQRDDDRIRFVVTDEEVWVANTGRPLDDRDVQGLCGLGASSKTDSTGKRRASIGHKGLGFKSVLEITNGPEAYSTSVAFRLGQDHARPLIEEQCRDLGRPLPRHVPAMRFPIGIGDLPPAWGELSGDGFHTAFRFPFSSRVTTAQRLTLADSLLDLPLTTVLFLKHLEEVTVEVRQVGRELSRTWLVGRQQRVDDHWAPCTGLHQSGVYRVDIAADDGAEGSFVIAHDADVEIGEHRSGLSGPAWDGVELTEVSVAVPDDRPAADVPSEWRRFHVFLPTQEPSTYPLLVNGAFSTDLSRQRVRVSDDPGDYNSHLIRQAAALYVAQLLPLLTEDGVARVLDTLDRRGEIPGPAAELLHEALSDALGDVPMLPTESGEPIAFEQSVLPPVVLGEEGEAFRRTLPVDASWQGRQFPASEVCIGALAGVAMDHGARTLGATEALEVLSLGADPDRSKLVDEPEGRFSLDPVLELCAALWRRCDADDRQAIEAVARTLRLFPVQHRDGGTVERIALGDDTAFYPPGSAREDLPLRGLRFMAHPVCWGQLKRRERQAVLDEQMKAWTALFDMREFRFEEVMRAAVLPGLVRNPSEDALELRTGNQNLDAIATICQLAGAVTKADKPLRLNRLGGDRAMFNLSRLPLPCRSIDGEPRWLPAYQVYFGEDWLGDESVESLVDAATEAGAQLDVAFLASPDAFLGRLAGLDSSDSDTEEPDTEVAQDDEVDLDDDTDQALETDEAERWLAFLSWIGVNRCLRLVHFHDVDDESTGWTKTKGLAQPTGWAFRDLDGTWQSFKESLVAALKDNPRCADTDPYLYVAHDLDQIVPLLHVAAQDRTAKIAALLFAHLARHWGTYGNHARAAVALVEKGKWPSSRNDPPRARPEEFFEVGDDLWLHRLRKWPICPTAQGPKRPSATWLPSEEIERRFGRRGRSSEDFLPILQALPDVLPQQLRPCSEVLGLRTDLSPSSFSTDDAHQLCARLIEVYPDGEISGSDLRSVIRPVYRQLFELLSGRSDDERLSGGLADSPLLSQDDAGLSFRPAHEVVYASVPGTRERSGIGGRVPLFVLEAEPSATAPLTSLFGVRVLEDVLEWQPQPGEPALEGDDLLAFKVGLQNLVIPLLARISAGRPEARERDRSTIARFVSSVEPVDSLDLRCSIGDTDLGELPRRSYFVRRTRRQGTLQAFVVWNGPAWPPMTEDAATLAMALADALEVNMVETFLAFIQADDAQRRQLLELAGATCYLAEVTEEPAAPEGEEGEATPEPTPTPGEVPDDGGSETPAGGPPDTGAAPERIALRRFDELLIDGEPVLVTGQVSGPPAGGGGGGSPHPGGAGGGTTGGGPVRAPAGMDLSALDQLGMAIALTYEQQRLQRLGHEAAVLPLTDGTVDTSWLVVDVHSPAAITAAETQSAVVKDVFDQLGAIGVSRLFPGFDILTIADGEVDRLIELKSSGVDARVQAMSWNEWKTARASSLREHFWLYLAGNLRADLGDAVPFLRAIRDPFGTLLGTAVEDTATRRAVQLRVREFGVAEELQLGLADHGSKLMPEPGEPGPSG